MAFETRNPLPPGRYYIDVDGVEKIRGFYALLNAAVALGVVTVINVELDGDSVDLQMLLQKILGGGNAHGWFLFSVADPSKGTFSIDRTTFGDPTIAPPSVTNEDDTIQAPPDPTIAAEATLQKFVALAEIVGFVLGVKTMLDLVKTLRSKNP